MMAALFASRAGARSVALLERNDRLGLKIGITGKGRCNLSNDCGVQELVDNVPVNGRFLYSAFSQMDSRKTMALFADLGLKLKVERGRRVFPESDRATELVLTLRRAIEQAGVRVRTQARVESLRTLSSGGFTLTGQGLSLTAKNVVIATGGLSYPITGSSGDGYRLARDLGHTLVKTRPALVPLESPEPWVRELQGLSLKNVTLTSPAGSELGEMLFTHFGISGPLVLSASGHIVDLLPKGPIVLTIDLKPGLDDEQLDARILRDFAEAPRRQFANSLEKLLPGRLVDAVVRLIGIAADKQVSQITREERQALVCLLKALPVKVTSPRPVEEAIVTAGGVSVKEVDPRTMESKLVKGLFFAGEVLDVSGYTGGYNLQIAWSTGAVAGSSAARRGTINETGGEAQ